MTSRAWVIDDTGIPKEGTHSPGVKRQYSGTLGKIGNCQITVSLHAVGGRGTAPLGWALHLPEEWCSDGARRRKAKISDEVSFQTKPELAAALAAEAAGWKIPSDPILADSAYGDDTAFRTRLDGLTLEYVMAVSSQIGVFGPRTTFSPPLRTEKRGRAPSAFRTDRKPQAVRALAEELPPSAFQMLVCRTTPAGEEVRGRFACLRVVAAHPVARDRVEPRTEWLVIEWPEGEGRWPPLLGQVGGRVKVEPAGVHYAALWSRSVKYA